MKKWRWLHKWLSLVFGLLLILWAASGILLNHRSLISGLDVPRTLLPENYKPDNYNLASIRSGLHEGDSLLVWGNIGIWITDTALAGWRPLMDGLPEGMDNRRTMCLLRASSGLLLAATQSGLYALDDNNLWHKIHLPLHDERIMDISEAEGNIYVVSRSEVFVSPVDGSLLSFREVSLPPSADEDGKTSLFRTLWVLHSGEVLGAAGKLVVDFFGLLMIFFVLTGYIYFFFPALIRRAKNKGRDAVALVAINRFSVRWHNKLGLWFGVFLIFTALTGMFLRPPLLIAIARSKVPKLKGTMLNHPNTWHDKLRALRYDAQTGGFLIVTNERIYFTPDLHNEPARPFPVQPPLSVMGINVLERLDDGFWLIGSFNGLFAWQPERGAVVDYFTGEPHRFNPNVSSPIGRNMVAGMIRLKARDMVFDYNLGLTGKRYAMPDELTRQGFPLWNLALEVHTGRVFQFLLGPLYILLVPVMGLIALVILISGLVIYIRRLLRKNHSK
ncbi:MAG: PepSY domain-containing protein [Bacteroidetes bacterium]|nr:PepSY domain-containing protein [Bacteroidota bacterium]